MILTRLLCPQEENMMPPPISALRTPYAFSTPPLAILMLRWRPQDMPPTTPSTLLLALHPRHLVSSCFHIKSIGYGGLLAYMMNAIKEIC
ncbi:hypothetical protein O181_052167 [Austropuccinia psidii MF-1]|uniref:Uncharacterized protein n=1 Tax=Austropuccinia psidii MF-1 TaxID=1389203 RepID=A0A9Q3E2D4_9BASI|nr:hypothetical protein [Austropuccinia psidii MF-1]